MLSQIHSSCFYVVGQKTKKETKGKNTREDRINREITIVKDLRFLLLSQSISIGLHCLDEQYQRKISSNKSHRYRQLRK